jgi:hypothetical protein
MTVRRISARRNRRTRRIAITFEVDPETWENMGRSARNAAHPDTLDYVAAVINTAFLEDDAGAATGEAHAQDKARAAPDTPQPAAEFDDIDDGIPF